MGGIPSRSTRNSDHENPEVKYPQYFIGDEVTHEDLHYACQSWALIVEDRGEEYLVNKDEINTYCVTWFYTLFYSRLFDIAPETKTLFRREIDQQGKMIVSLITFALNSFYEDSENLRSKLQKLATAHAAYGVVSSQYNQMGEVLFWTLSKVLGSQFCEPTKLAWVRIYSSLLKIILPVAVEEEKRIIAADVDRPARKPTAETDYQNGSK